MKLLHQLGHKKNWNAETFYQNGIGDGFIFCAYSYEYEKIGTDFYTHKREQYMPISMLDLQFYGGKNSIGGKLNTYPFHPIHRTISEGTEVSLIQDISSAIQFQEESGFQRIIIPHIYNLHDSDYTISVLKSINNYLKKNKKDGLEYFMTLPFSVAEIKNANRVEQILQAATDMHVCLDGYYIVCEQNLTGNRKISEDPDYYENLSKIFSTLKRQEFKLIHGFSNVDAVLFSSITDIDYISIGTYEVQRSFNIDRYTEELSGGGSKGWYFSEKLLSFIRAQEISLIRKNGGLDLIKNDDNIFSDTILKESYDWNIHKPEVHKNYLVAVSRLLHIIHEKGSAKDKMDFTLSLALEARSIYRQLEQKGIFLSNESSGYHLPFWQTILTQNLDH